ncbi:MAG: nitric oxide reductase activation protein NorD [Desulfopila sp.]
MTADEIKRLFYHEVGNARPNDWEVDEIVEQLGQLPADRVQALLGQVHVVWPVSHSLCFSFLQYGCDYLRRSDTSQLAVWVRELLGHYEKDGLRGARLYMAQSAATGGGGAGDSAVRLEEVRGRLLPFLHGLSGSNLEIMPATVAWTDTETVYLPVEINLFDDRRDNERLYTFLTSCQWGYLALGTFFPLISAGGEGGLAASLSAYDDPDLAATIYHFLEFSRVCNLLAEELPGLMRQVLPLIRSCLAGRSRLAAEVDDNAYWGPLKALIDSVGGDARDEGAGTLAHRGEEPASLAGIAELYSHLPAAAANDWAVWQPLTGRLDYGGVRARLAKRRLEDRQVAIKELALIINRQVARKREEIGQGGSGGAQDGGDRLVVRLATPQETRAGYGLRIDNVTVELPAELADTLSRIERDLGRVPQGYVQAAAGIGSQGVMVGSGGSAEGGESRSAEGSVYDEWDYRRRGYRKNWCTVLEKELQPVRSSFVENTFVTYQGLLVRLRRQFESLRTRHRFVRRRRDGDDVDLDALVEAMADRTAGIAPSERLFVRLLRDSRDIAVLFLVDMSNSTEGWVGKAIKESLVLLGDVLEVVGDRYAIYGFSGMRRSRCEVYRIKRFDEPYGEPVRQRICAISPKEYTRMAAPIRHLTRTLLASEAKIRLLMVISDGKPEDYDDYKGEYAIEDTRQALYEARGKGIIPFCITVDRQPQAYLPHMFGRDNYVVVDSVEKLPLRMPEIYRLLTS